MTGTCHAAAYNALLLAKVFIVTDIFFSGAGLSVIPIRNPLCYVGRHIVNAIAGLVGGI
jgi:hypothetical protein